MEPVHKSGAAVNGVCLATVIIAGYCVLAGHGMAQTKAGQAEPQEVSHSLSPDISPSISPSGVQLAHMPVRLPDHIEADEPSANTAIIATYHAYARGLHVADVIVRVVWNDTHYHVLLESRTAGILQWIRSTWSITEAAGGWQDGSPVPSLFLSTGSVNGRQSVTEVLYRKGQPSGIRLGPEDAVHKISTFPFKNIALDSLSAMVALTHHAALSGGCAGTATTFDGRRMATIHSTLSGKDQLLSPVSDEAKPVQTMRCDIVGQKQAVEGAGIPASRPWHATAWLGPAGPAPVFPIRMRFDDVKSRWMGSITFYLDSISTLPD
ncbi:DUF3108 domain-containing protein [Granulibacter bethesdensis]|uniref:DUF3108 domain-containing protein n=1 Tax=Granulibacter bethesdensis TaxID=364410 RepID=UPI0003F21955|nr:DUF3108 domain-containing protein [Granulibacter bethesdensis]AHJ68958.1 Hypothetical protein GbCGDNIH2_1241 [Granulibacter bethesdensis]